MGLVGLGRLSWDCCTKVKDETFSLMRFAKFRDNGHSYLMTGEAFSWMKLACFSCLSTFNTPATQGSTCDELWALKTHVTICSWTNMSPSVCALWRSLSILLNPFPWTNVMDGNTSKNFYTHCLIHTKYSIQTTFKSSQLESIRGTSVIRSSRLWCCSHPIYCPDI